MKKDGGYVWIDPDLMQQLIETRDPLYAVGFIVLASYVDDRGRVSCKKAIDGLVAAFSEIDEMQAKALLARFVEAGLATVDDQTIILPGCGTAFIPNQKHKAPGSSSRK
ncbi:hypothetical protein [Paracoccus tibetensis]|uniref:Uncharacterized protein n=1 Tax=Paracoccus tibetensis TaxID=336292 RepID=A0A1G5JZM3_9RHOB|nr:hypothetical protein [Paracoccus tibetensis]SCY93882.1 hypothetical protein SAMN05660710_03575 [Paracoccus tibetensis]